MCLSYNASVTAYLRKRFRKNPGKPLVFYKYYVKGETYLSCFHMTRHKSYCPGTIFSNRASANRDEEEIKYAEVAKGIHVFLNRKDARNEAGRLERICTLETNDTLETNEKLSIVKVLAYEKNLIGAGFFHWKESAVFTSVEISRATWRNLF